MTLNEKRLVIEALLCAGAGNQTTSLVVACVNVGCSPSKASYEAYRYLPISKQIRYEDRLVDAAYRLAASEWVLVREWFG